MTAFHSFLKIICRFLIYILPWLIFTLLILVVICTLLFQYPHNIYKNCSLRLDLWNLNLKFTTYTPLKFEVI